MLRAENAITIDASREAVFEYMDRPENHAEITPALSSVRTIERIENGGARASYVYRVGPISLTGEVRATTYEPPERIDFEMIGDLEGTIRWRFDDRDGWTRVRYAAAYGMPRLLSVPPLSWLATWYNDRQLRGVLEALRREVESRNQESR